MELVLTRLRDFSCREATFDTCKSAEALPHQDVESRGCFAEEPRGGSPSQESRTHRLDIETSLAWLRKELVRPPRNLLLLLFDIIQCIWPRDKKSVQSSVHSTSTLLHHIVLLFSPYISALAILPKWCMLLLGHRVINTSVKHLVKCTQVQQYNLYFNIYSHLILMVVGY